MTHEITSCFVYNELLDAKCLKKLKRKFIYRQPAEAEARITTIKGQPIALLNDKIRRLTYKKVFGTILTFEKRHMKYIVSVLDSYHTCSLSRIGISSPYDLTTRIIAQVYPIHFTTIDEFINYRYVYILPTIPCYMWIGNELCEEVKNTRLFFTTRIHKEFANFLRKEYGNAKQYGV